MKRDVTQNGVRTQRGAVDDAMSAAQRFFSNNLRDQHKQVGIDLLLGLADYETLIPQTTSTAAAARSAGRVVQNQHRQAPAPSSMPASVPSASLAAQRAPRRRSIDDAGVVGEKGDGSRSSGDRGGAVDKDVISGGSVAAAKREPQVEGTRQELDASKSFLEIDGAHHASLAANRVIEDEPTGVQDIMNRSNAQAPEDAVLRVSERKIEAVLSDLLKEVTMLRSVPQLIQTSVRVRTGKKKALQDEKNEVFLIEEQYKCAPVIHPPLHRTRKTAIIQIQIPRRKMGLIYITKIAIMLLAPIALFVRYLISR